MYRTEDRFPFKPETGKAFSQYFHGRRPVFLDIETEGLSPRHHRVILIGSLITEAGTAHTIQYLCEKPGDEEDVLRAALSALSPEQFLVTYNGRSFDVPFLQRRAAWCGVDSSVLSRIYDLDLYPLVKYESDLRNVLPSLSQKSIETYLGIAGRRRDRIDGGTSVVLTERFFRQQSESDRDRILLHNHDDIAQLARLLPILKICDLHHGMLKSGFPAGDFLVRNIRAGYSGLHAEAFSVKPIRNYIAFPTAEFPCRITASADGRVELDFPSEPATEDLSVLDLTKLLPASEKIPGYPGIESGYLVLREKYAAAVNAFLSAFLCTIAPLLAA